jgi:FemAB-related protein (PEP-CTERM system-associated)
MIGAMRQSLAAPETEGASVLIRPFAEGDGPAWDSFVAAAPDATLFHGLAWQRAVTTSLGHEAHHLCAWRGDRLAGVLPLIHVRSRLFGNALFSAAFGVYGGILAADDEAALALALEAARLGDRLGVDYVELRHIAETRLGWVTKSDLYVTFCRTLAASSEANLKSIPRKKRADLRKAIDNKQLAVEVGVDLDTFYRIYSESVRNLGTPVMPRRFYAAILAELGAAAELSAVRGPDGHVAALMTFYFRDRVMPYYGGATPAARPLHAYDLLYWSQMERAVARGTPVYDFGRSKRGTGSFDYKTYWGFAPEPLHYAFHLGRKRELPDVNPLNPKYRLMIETWRRLPLAIANTAGPFIARQIG